MIIDELTIEDFGVYAGSQTIELSPPDASKPIVLIGGLNGGGKTTFLDAIQLCLYGQFAPCSNRGRLGYHEFLKRCINQLDENRDAKIELAFRHTVDGVEEHYRVTRSWLDSGKSISEKFRVLRNGEDDTLLAENWTESVERILPRRIANLFLFDGEKIEAYASPEASSELIKTATHSLLGMDVVDQLERDLNTLQQRKVKSTGNSKVRREVDEAQAEFDRLVSERRAVDQERAAIRTHELDRIEKKLQEVERVFEQNGGLLFETQTELEAEFKRIQDEISSLQEEIREIAAGNLPLVLVRDLLGNVLDQARDELSSRNNMSFVKQARDRDRSTLAFLEQRSTDQNIVKILRQHFEEDLNERLNSCDEESYLELSPSALALCEQEYDHGLESTYALCQARLKALEALELQRAQKELQLSSVPAEEAIREILIERSSLQDQLTDAKTRLDALDEEHRRLVNMTDRAKQRLAALLEKRVRSDFKDEDDLRIINHAQRVQRTLSQFRKLAVERHIGRIEELVNKSFTSLHRKENTVQRISIDIDTFAITLIGARGEELPSERLSAGERQLLAVAVLWGLAQASSRQLPTVIDTPLGRLDSSHRSNLVDRYFPHASHQVILLSTDEEIAGGYLERLSTSIGRQYELVFDEVAHTTRIRSGYFVEGGDRVH